MSINSINFKEDEMKDKDTCNICLENFEENESLFKTACNHLFHKDCLCTWTKIRSTCPVCRETIRDLTSEEIDSMSEELNFISEEIDYVRNAQIIDLIPDSHSFSGLENYVRNIENRIHLSPESQNNIRIIANTLRNNPDITSNNLNNFIDNLDATPINNNDINTFRNNIINYNYINNNNYNNYNNYINNNE